jgi:hypothetical protein
LITRINTGGQSCNPDVNGFGKQNLEHLVCTSAARIVTIKHHNNAICIATQKTCMSLTKCRTENCNNVVDASLSCSKTICIAFHNEGSFRMTDGLSR